MNTEQLLLPGHRFTGRVRRPWNQQKALLASVAANRLRREAKVGTVVGGRTVLGFVRNWIGGRYCYLAKAECVKCGSITTQSYNHLDRRECRICRKNRFREKCESYKGKEFGDWMVVSISQKERSGGGAQWCFLMQHAKCGSSKKVMHRPGSKRFWNELDRCFECDRRIPVGTKRLNHYGYVIIKTEEHPDSHNGGWVFEHRLVMEKHIRRRLKKNETVHHIDGHRQNNDISNLELWEKQHCAGVRKKDLPIFKYIIKSNGGEPVFLDIRSDGEIMGAGDDFVVEKL